MSSEELAFGKTKIFIRSPKTVSCRGTCVWWGWTVEELESPPE